MRLLSAWPATAVSLLAKKDTFIAARVKQWDEHSVIRLRNTRNSFAIFFSALLSPQNFPLCNHQLGHQTQASFQKDEATYIRIYVGITFLCIEAHDRAEVGIQFFQIQSTTFK
jgi:hypothetical protein